VNATLAVNVPGCICVILFTFSQSADSIAVLHDVLHVLSTTGDQMLLIFGLHLWWIADQLYGMFLHRF